MKTVKFRLIKDKKIQTFLIQLKLRDLGFGFLKNKLLMLH